MVGSRAIANEQHGDGTEHESAGWEDFDAFAVGVMQLPAAPLYAGSLSTCWNDTTIIESERRRSPSSRLPVVIQRKDAKIRASEDFFQFHMAEVQQIMASHLVASPKTSTSGVWPIASALALLL